MKVVTIFSSTIKFILYLTGVWFLLSNTLIGFEQRSLIYPYIDTTFSKDFTMGNWIKIQTKDNKNQVLALIGNPIHIDTLHNCTILGEQALYKMSYSDNGNWITDYAWCSFSLYLDSSQNIILKEQAWSDEININY
ncbi:MAG: hypothetical protein RLZZ292_2202 [Bacteroidota bacterium]|jgi:hypothetical protein